MCWLLGRRKIGTIEWRGESQVLAVINPSFVIKRVLKKSDALLLVPV
jgi:hypothetical protein